MNNLNQQAQDVQTVTSAEHSKKLTKFTSYAVHKDGAARIDTTVKATKNKDGSILKAQTALTTHINFLPTTLESWLTADCTNDSELTAREQLLSTYLTDTAVMLAKETASAKGKQLFSFLQVLDLMRDLHKLDVASIKISVAELKDSGFLSVVAQHLTKDSPQNFSTTLQRLAGVIQARFKNIDFKSRESSALDFEQQILAIDFDELIFTPSAEQKAQKADYVASLKNYLALRFVDTDLAFLDFDETAKSDDAPY
jgi:hypothetical protein